MPWIRSVLWGCLVAVSVPPAMARAVMDEVTRRQKIQELYEKQIPLLEQYVEKYPNGDRAADSLFRLGEAYSESSKFVQLQGNDSRAALFSQRAVQALERLRANHPHFGRIDEALLVLATAYMDRGQNEQAGSVLAEIADRFPNSPIMEQAAFLIGDFYFDKRQFARARQYYERASSNPRTQAYAHYKLAWVAIQQNQPGVALQNFEKVLELNADPSKSSFDYSRDAAREIVWPAIEVHQASRVVQYLERILKTPELLKHGLSHLGQGLLQKGEYSTASRVFEYLINRFPQDSHIDPWLTGQLEAEEKMGRVGNIVQIVSRLKGQNIQSPALQSQLYSSAKKYHAEAQAERDATRKNQLYDQAIAYYQAFQQVGQGAKQFYETQFYLGEALYTRGRFQEALAVYEQAAKNSHERQLDASWNWYLTAEKLAPGFKYEGKTLRATTPQDEKFLEAAAHVSRLEAMDQTRRRRASYQSARLVYQLNDFDRALPIFQSLAQNHAGTEEGKLSAQLVLDIYNLREDFENVARYARAFQAGADSSVRSELSVLEQQAVFKTIQEEEKRARALPEANRASALQSSAKKYLQFAQQYPQSSLVDASVWAAIQLFATSASMTEDRQFSDLRASFQLLVRNYPKSKFVPEAVKLLGEFLAFTRPDTSILSAYQEYRDTWLTQMRAQPAANRGSLAMIVYALSNDAQKRSLEAEFVKLPVSSENREAIAHGRIQEIRKLHASYEGIAMNQLKTLQANTRSKISSLNKLETEVTNFVRLGEPRLAIESLRILETAYRHMGEALRQAPVPGGLEAEDLEKYRAAVSEQAATYDVKAAETRALAERTARELG